MPSSACPNCQERVYVKAETEQGSILTCDECESELELVGLDPLQLDPYEEKDTENYGDGFNIYDNDGEV